MKVLRTFADRFADLPCSPFSPHHVEVDDGEGGRLRVANLDEGREPSAAGLACGGDRIVHNLVSRAAGREHVTLTGGGHFLQEHIAPRFAAVIAQFVATT